MNINLDKNQKLAVETNKKNVLVAAAAGSGKALENGSIVYTEQGQKKIEDLKIGELIYGEDGNLHSVIGIFPQGKKRKYIVKFSDGTEINCCDEHLWTFQTASQRSHKSKNWNTKTLREIINNYNIFIKTSSSQKVNCNKRRNLFIPMTEPVKFSERPVPLDPYTLGALLGDGSLGTTGKQSIFSNNDEDVIKKVNDGLVKIGCNLTTTSRNKCDYAIIQNSKKGEIGPFNKILKTLKLENAKSNNKFIPNLYKYNSIETRLELLKGLIDTDGYCDGSSYDIVLKSKQLILDIKEVCESLGFTAVYQEKKAICTNSSEGKKDCGIVYRLRIKTSKSIPKIHFSQKREKQYKPSTVYAHRAIEEIIETDEYVEMTCISVDNPTSLFLTNNFIVTHNTRVITERLKYLLNNDVDPKTIYAITYTNAAAQEMRNRLNNTDVFIGTIHSLANRILLLNGVDTSSFLEEEEFDYLFTLIKEREIELPIISHLLVDEFQDITDNEYEFISNILISENKFYCGDSRQSIYSFKGSNYKYFMRLVNDPFTYVYELNNNYRCGGEIIDFAQTFIDRVYDIYDTPVYCASGLIGEVEQTTYQTSTILSYLENKDYKDWFIICRTNNEVDNILALLTKNSIPCVNFRKSELTLEELNEKVNSDVVKVLTIHSAKGLESKNVMVVGAKTWNAEELRVCYVAATRAKEKLIWLTEPKKTYKRKQQYNMTSWG